jgi:hypothetical protein
MGHPSTMLLKLVDILDQLNLLVIKEKLPDSILLDINSISLPTFFVEGIHSMQMSALNVIRSVCFFILTFSFLFSLFFLFYSHFFFYIISFSFLFSLFFLFYSYFFFFIQSLMV